MAIVTPVRANEHKHTSHIQLELRPRVCTLSANDTKCNTTVHASWQSTEEESLCVVIAERPDIKRCWDHHSHGTYSVELEFSDDLLFQLRDLDLQNVLAAKTLTVIREALQFRHKRRQPWNIIF